MKNTVVMRHVLIVSELAGRSVVVKRVCDRFDKRREWSDEGPSVARPVMERRIKGPSPAQREVTRDWLETCSTPTNVVKGPSGGAALEELTQMVRDLQIAQARRDLLHRVCFVSRHKG